MTKPIVLLAALLLAGCESAPPESIRLNCLPCNEFEKGFWYRAECKDCPVERSHCIPCAKAKTPEQRFVCFGETVEAPVTFETRVVVGGGGGGAPVRRGYPLQKMREYKDQDGKTWSEYSKETK